jgi:putative endonuclease
MHPHQLGRRSEDIACAYLISRGWEILDRNYRAGHKEIDIIARFANTIAFVEVKARAGDAWGHPLESITWAKRREIAYVARAWLQANGRPSFEYRFDAIAICWRGSSHVLEHVGNAWSIQRRG